MQTLNEYVLQYEQQNPKKQGISQAINDINNACQQIEALVSQGALNHIYGKAGETNVQGEEQQKMDVLANQIMLEILEKSGHWAGIASEEMEFSYPIKTKSENAKYLCLFDPLDGSGNIDINMPIGTIFSILPYRSDRLPTDEDFLQPGKCQVAAGYVLYGASTVLVLTLGNGVASFTLDHERKEFLLTEDQLQIPADCSDFSINMSNYQFWYPAIREYIDDCLAGKSGSRGRDYNMRWMGCMVADSHKALLRGGVFMYPSSTKNPKQKAKLRLMYEANPIGMIIEQAGGRAITEDSSILEIKPEQLHQRISVIMGSKNEIDHIEALCTSKIN